MKTKPILSAKQLTPLIEIILVMAFFAGASTILIQVFAKAHNDSRLAHDINSATLYISECAERIRAAESYEAISDALHRSGFENNDNDYVYIVYLDAGFCSVHKDISYSTVSFEVSIKDTQAGKLITGHFACIRKDGEELISMDTAVHMHNTRDMKP